jgi:DNA-binding LacI/PurR family transcriptional regulator
VAKSPTVYDVAERAGVSIATVSFTFRQPKKVKESTRQLVRAAAEELGYIPSANARGLADGRTGALGILSLDYGPAIPESNSASGPPAVDPNVDFRFFPLYKDEVQRGVEAECWRRGYAVMVAGASRFNADAVLTDIAGRVDGLAIFSGSIGDAVLRRIAARLPVVMLTGSRVDDDLSRVSVDNADGMRELTEHLINSHGLRELRFVGSIAAADRTERFAAFRATLRAANLPVPRKPLAPTVEYQAIAADLRAMAADLIARNALPQAFVCVTDEVALALMDALSDAGVHVPGEVAVTGFDGLVAGRLVTPTLTTVRQPMEAMGAIVVRDLIDRIERPDEPTTSRRLPVQLVLRESCGCPPKPTSRAVLDHPPSTGMN